MSVKLERMILNLLLRDDLRRTEQHFCLLETVFHNHWNYRIRMSSTEFSMIDTDGFQHKPKSYFAYGCVAILKTGEIVKAQFPEPQYELEAESKTRGWLWLDPLPENVFPHRFVFRFNIFDPGEISGRVKDTETLELVISDFIVSSIKQLPSLPLTG